MGQTRDEERATIEASHAKASSRANDLAVRILEARSFIYSTFNLGV